MAEGLFMTDRVAAPERPSTSPALARPAPAGPPADIRAWIKPVEKFIGDHPGACLASALIVGAAVAWWIKRR
jgi:hypothetical protein